MACISCGTQTRCPCGCGDPYISENRWQTPIAVELGGTVTENVPENVPKIRGRGRPRSDIHLTEAERKRKYRERQRNSAQPAEFDTPQEAEASYKFAFMNRIDAVWRLLDVYDGATLEVLDDEMRELMEATSAKATALAKRLREVTDG